MCMCVSVDVCMTCVYVCVGMCACARAFICVHVYTYVYECVYAYVCTSVYVCVYICIHVYYVVVRVHVHIFK